ncbi:multi-sensor signal transduction histidine kinase, partial [mine drainage metagenome]
MDRPSWGIQKLDFVGVEGRAKDYVDGLVISSDPNIPEGRGPGGQALRSGDPVISTNFSFDPDFTPWLHKAERFGLTSSANFSFSRGGRVIGSMGLYKDYHHSFFPEQISLFRQFASTLSFALDNWDREKLRKANEAEMALVASVALN